MRRSLAFVIILVVFSLGIGGERYQPAGPLRADKDGEKWAQKTLKKMSVEQKVGQLFMIWARAEFLNVDSSDYMKMVDAIHKYHLGGYGLTVPVDGPFLIKNQPYEAAMLTNALQRESEIPLLIAADYERGLAMRMNGVTAFPHAMALGATGNPQYANDMGRITAEEARAIGVHWNFFPDADVNSNPNNPIINTRAFGEDPEQVGTFVKSYILGARASGLLTTAKHFPGHGDTDTDSHLAVSRVNGSLERLNQVELVPFRDAITAGVDSVMTSHLSVPALEPDPNKVATVSANVITHLLREQLGFRGLVVTDAMDMNALMRIYQGPDGPAGASGRAAVAAFLAGNDMLLIPQDMEGAYSGVLQAVKKGVIPESRLDESVMRILLMKAAVGLNKKKEVDINALSTLVSRPDNVALAQKMADDAITLVRFNGQALPIRVRFQGTSNTQLAYSQDVQARNRLLVIIFTDDMRSENGRMLERQIRARVPDANIVYVDNRVAAPLTPQLLQAAGEAQSVVAAVYVIPSAGRRGNGVAGGSIGMAEGSGNLLVSLLRQADKKTVVVAMGNPYVATDFPEVENYMCTFSNSPVSEISAAKALFGEIAIHGRLPVTIPGLAARGTGINRAVETRQ